MRWNEIIGQENIIKMLRDSIEENRISHAQLFVGKDGYGTFPLAWAYASGILLRENPNSEHEIEHLNHLDLHLSFPTYSSSEEKVRALSDDFVQARREMLLENPYATYQDWIFKLNSEKKQLFISVEEIEAVIEKFNLKSFEGGSKILIISKIEKMNIAAANKFLKFLEEPPENTVILLTAESTDYILPTILSRCQIVQVPRIKSKILQTQLINRFHVPENKVAAYAFEAQGDWNLAQKLVSNGETSNEFETYFIAWVRNAFQAKTKLSILQDILSWAQEIAAWSRDKQIRFLEYCGEIFRLALLQSYQAEDLVYKELSENGFKWKGFTPFIHGSNIESILEEISKANLHVSRNGNSKIIWTDMGIKLTRYIHRSAS